MKIVEQDNDILYRPTAKFDFSNPPIDPVDLSTQMIDFMRKGEFVGLAANQVGYPYRVFVMEGSPAFAIFNPRIVDMSDESVKLVEGCATFKDLWLEIERPEWVKIRFQTPNGETTTKLFGGYHARVILHEIDHLDGKVYTWKVSPYVLSKAKKKQRLIRQNKANSKHYNVSSFSEQYNV